MTGGEISPGSGRLGNPRLSRLVILKVLLGQGIMLSKAVPSYVAKSVFNHLSFVFASAVTCYFVMVISLTV